MPLQTIVFIGAVIVFCMIVLVIGALDERNQSLRLASVSFEVLPCLLRQNVSKVILYLPDTSLVKGSASTCINPPPSAADSIVIKFLRGDADLVYARYCATSPRSFAQKERLEKELTLQIAEELQYLSSQYDKIIVAGAAPMVALFSTLLEINDISLVFNK